MLATIRTAGALGFRGFETCATVINQASAGPMAPVPNGAITCVRHNRDVSHLRPDVAEEEGQWLSQVN